jgi:hypothetical protein
MRALHPTGRNYLVVPIVGAPYERSWGNVTLRVVNATHLRAELGAVPSSG